MAAQLAPQTALQTLPSFKLLLLSSRQQALFLLAGRVAQPEAKLMISFAHCLAWSASIVCCGPLNKFSLLVRLVPLARPSLERTTLCRKIKVIFLHASWSVICTHLCFQHEDWGKYPDSDVLFIN